MGIWVGCWNSLSLYKTHLEDKYYVYIKYWSRQVFFHVTEVARHCASDLNHSTNRGFLWAHSADPRVSQRLNLQLPSLATYVGKMAWYFCQCILLSINIFFLLDAFPLISLARPDASYKPSHSRATVVQHKPPKCVLQPAWVPLMHQTSVRSCIM